MNNFFNLCIVTVVLCITACTDSTPIGGDIIDGTQLPISYREDISFSIATDTAISTELTTGIAISEIGVPVGCVSSPYTGSRNARIGMQILERADELDLTTAVVDSIILILPLQPDYQVGDTTAQSNLRVLGATTPSFENLEPLIKTPLQDNGVVFGEATAVPKRVSSPTLVYDGDSTRMDTVGPEFRIPMNQDFRDAFLPVLTAAVANDTIINDSLFSANFPGIVIEGGDCGRTSPGVDLSLDRQDRMGVFVYYTDSGFQRQYQFNYRRASTAVGRFRPEYVHDFSGTPAEQLASGNNLNDTLAIVKSLGGLMLRVDLTAFEGLSNQAVNSAILEIPVVPGTEDFISPLTRLIPRVKNNFGDLVDYSATSPNGSSTFTEAEGGFVESVPDPRDATADNILVYRFNITSLAQRIISGDQEPELFLVANAQTFFPGESILRGTGGATNALRARILLATTDTP